MTLITRRDLLKSGAGAMAGAAVLTLRPRPLLAHLGGAGPVLVPPIQDFDIKQLVFRAVEASRAAGAGYAEVRLSHTWERECGTGSVTDEEAMHVGVRAQVDGYWGFASGTVWSPDEMGRLSREAVAQAKVNALGKARPFEWAPAPPVKDGHWATPVRTDPFEVSPLEVVDELAGLHDYAFRLMGPLSSPDQH